MNFSPWWSWVKRYRYELILCLAILVAVPFYWRNPYGLRTLIPNLEPYPDTFHYLLPPLNWLRGHGFLLWRPGGEGLSPSVPPLYSLFLLPWLAVAQDVRIFFFANLFLTLVAAVQIWQLIRILTKNWVLTGLATVLFLLNPYTIWLPNLAMSENLFLVLYLWALWLLAQKVTPKRALQAGLLAMSFYATKYAAAPLTALFPLLYLVKLWPEVQTSFQSRRLSRSIVWWIAGLVVSAGSFLLYQEIVYGNSFLSSAIGLVQVLISSEPGETGHAAGGVARWAFSLSFVSEYAPRYWNSLFGSTDMFLWHQASWWPVWLSILSWGGLVIAWWKQRRWRWLLSSMLIFLMGQLLFMSTFYAFDLRYFILAYPSLLIFLVLGLATVSKQEISSLPVGAMIFFLLFTGSFSVYKTQLLLNFRSAETPWYYVSVQEVDRYFREKNITHPAVISAMNPYYFDLMGKGDYTLLPLSDQQDFFWAVNKVWGQGEYSDLLELYTSVWESGRPLYVAQYGLGNVPAYKNAYALVEQRFVLEKVLSGCHELCNLYQITGIASDSASGTAK